MISFSLQMRQRANTTSEPLIKDSGKRNNKIHCRHNGITTGS
jgi:hypothetical protein